MRTISPHRVWFPAFEERVKTMSQSRAEQIAFVEEHFGGVNSRSSNFYRDARISLSVDPEAGYLETWEAWTSAMQMYHALFAVTTAAEGDRVECLIDHKVRVLKGMGPKHFTSAGNWLVAFYLAVTCRDQQRWTELAGISVDLLREMGESKGGRYNRSSYHWIAALQAMVHNDRETLFRELEKAIELCDSRNAEFGGEMLDNLVFPVMNTFRCLVQFDPAGFSEALAQGLELFRDYHTADEERSEDMDGIVPLGLLAMACLAHDRNTNRSDFPLEVESGYLPKFILNGSWLGEFPIGGPEPPDSPRTRG